MPKKKRYFFSVIEESICNPEYRGWHGGRIEVYDREAKSKHACYEARFFLPEEFYYSFRKIWDFKESDKMPFIRWDYEGDCKKRAKSAVSEKANQPLGNE